MHRIQTIFRSHGIFLYLIFFSPMHSPSTSSASKYQAVQSLVAGQAPFALIRRGEEQSVALYEGDVTECELLDDIPRQYGRPENGLTVDTVSALPFSQIRERGFAAREDDARISCIRVINETRIALKEFCAALPPETIELEDGIQFEPDAKEAEDMFRRIIREEIGNGAGANFVVPRTATAKIREMSRAKALAIFQSLVQGEFGSHMTFAFCDGQKYLIGASPERHLSVEKGTVHMNPISGTARKREMGKEPVAQKQALMRFLGDDKEIMELFMVLDEELKMIAQMCEQGGTIEGPLLKEMANVIHTEYVLKGRSKKDVLELLRRSMFAPTIVGSPMKNACEVNLKYDPKPRRYYGSALMLLGRDADGGDVLDSAITIRTMEIASDGTMNAKAGATLVRDSDPAEEVKETEAKLQGLFQALKPSVGKIAPSRMLTAIDGPEVQHALKKRNQFLSRFLSEDQEGKGEQLEELIGKHVTILDNGDDFSHMLRHMIAHMGAIVTVLPTVAYDADADDSDIVVVGPGPGNPNDEENAEMQHLKSVMRILRERKKILLGVCLGHQILCKDLGLSLERQEIPTQGEQKEIDLFGSREKVGFYNTFAARKEERDDVEFAADEGGCVHAVKGDGFVGFQFHPESILSENGYDVLGRTLKDLIAQQLSPVNS